MQILRQQDTAEVAGPLWVERSHGHSIQMTNLRLPANLANR